MADINRRWLIRRRPVGLPSESDFELVREPVPELPDGALLVQNHYCSLDPAIRGWLKDAPSYMPPIALDDAIRVVSIGRVAASRQEDFKVGDWVFGVMAIEDYSIVRPDGFLRILSGKSPRLRVVARLVSPAAKSNADDWSSAIGLTLPSITRTRRSRNCPNRSGQWRPTG